MAVAAKALKTNNEIVLRKADKSSTYVILDKVDYYNKLNTILSDETKFSKIKKDPTISIKKEANKLIATLNSGLKNNKIKQIVGDYSPAYLYGNVKLHKSNCPVRPIISQRPAPTFQLAKSINRMIVP